jgi:UDP-glucose 4-epimerase
MSNCLVTGGCGFIGRHLVRKLQEGLQKVYILDKVYDDDLQNDEGDIVKDFAEELDFINKPIDVIFHLAAVSRTVPAIEDPIECIRTNVLGTVSVLEAARQAKVPRVVVASSNVVLAGITPYRDSKRAVEDLCITYANLYKQSVIGLRFSNVYGPNIPVGDPAVFAMLRDSYNKNGWANVTGDGEQTRDFTHVDDIVRGMIAAWNSDVTGIVELCTGVQTSINKACKMLNIPVKYIEDRPGDCREMVQSSTPAKVVLGWQAEIPIEKGIQSIWEV